MKINLSHEWLTPYLLASLAGLISSLYLLRQKKILNRLYLGINLYFLSGAFGLLTNWNWLNHLYGELRGLGMLYCILFVGIISSLSSPFGFLGIRSSTNHSMQYWSAGLLLTCMLAIFIAVYFSQHIFWGEWFPFILLFTAKTILEKLSCESK